MSRDLVYEVSGLLPETVVVSIKKELTISEDIDTEVDTAARIYGFYAVLAEKAESRWQKMRFASEGWIAGVEARTAKERSDEKLKNYTEAQMKAHVKSQPKYRSYQLKLMEFDEHRRILKIIAKAFELKIELVRTKAANRRREGEGSGRG